jgi:hypothetical protein
MKPTYRKPSKPPTPCQTFCAAASDESLFALPAVWAQRFSSTRIGSAVRRAAVATVRAALLTLFRTARRELLGRIRRIDTAALVPTAMLGWTATRESNAAPTRSTYVASARIHWILRPAVIPKLDRPWLLHRAGRHDRRTARDSRRMAHAGPAARGDGCEKQDRSRN